MKRIALLVIVLCINTITLAQSTKSVSVLGDSYSTFGGYMEPSNNALWYTAPPSNDTDVTSVTQTWWHQFIKNNGYRLCVNNSFSGSTICNTGYGGEDYSDRSFITRMDNLGSPDIIFIYGATNDSWAGAPIGDYKYEGWTKQELHAFRPAMAHLLDYVTNRYINVEIYYLLNDFLKPEIKESVKTICNHYGVTCIDIVDIELQSGHPSVKGMQQISDQIEAFLNK
jgi:lysophospholipase L1-like esterase